jgi:hypothetical protein
LAKSKVEKMLDYMNSKKGCRYSQSNRWGSKTFDCSSLVYRAWQSAGVTMSGTTAAYEVDSDGFTLIWPSSMSRVKSTLGGGRNLLSRLNVQPGDHVFYRKPGHDRRWNIAHIATVNRSGKQIIHAIGRGVTTDSLDYWHSAICAVIRYKHAGSVAPPNSGADDENEFEEEQQKEITDEKTIVTIGEKAKARDLTALNAGVSNRIHEIIIQNNGKIYYPVIQDEITWETERKSSPGRLNFSVVADARLSIQEGNPVRFSYKGKKLFFGFVFSIQRNKDSILNITAYDQLRYLKNKDSCIYKNKTAAELIKMLADNYGLNVGAITDTKYKIESRIEDNMSLLDIIQNALDLTLENKKKLYVLYDKCGKLTLRNIENMKITLLIDKTTAEDYDYTSSIDGDTYNKIKLAYDNGETGVREFYIAQHGLNINRWGVLQHYEKITDTSNAKTQAKTLLNLYNRKCKTLSISNAVGYYNVRAGCSVIIKLDLGDVKLQNFMTCEKAKHTFKEGEHFMELNLRGGEEFFA